LEDVESFIRANDDIDVYLYGMVCASTHWLNDDYWR
jgi:hypothetical protein